MRTLPLWLRCYAIAMIVFILTPLAVVVIAAFNSAEYNVFPPPGFSMRWIKKAVTDPEFIGPLWNSVVLGVSATVGTAIVGVPAALLLARHRFRFKQELEAFLLSPLTLPHIVLATGLLFYVNMIGLGGNFIGLLAGHMVITLPYMLRTVYSVYVGCKSGYRGGRRGPRCRSGTHVLPSDSADDPARHSCGRHLRLPNLL